MVDRPPPPESPRPPTEEQRQRQEEPHADDSLDTYVCTVDSVSPFMLVLNFVLMYCLVGHAFFVVNREMILIRKWSSITSQTALCYSPALTANKYTST